MGKELYTWEQVRAYGEIALHNLTKSANEINMRNFKKCIKYWKKKILCAKIKMRGNAK